MNTIVLAILFLVVVALMFIVFNKPQDQKSAGQSHKGPLENHDSHSSGSLTAQSQTATAPSFSSSLLDQLSMINAREYPMLSLHQLPSKIKNFVGRKEIIQEILGRSWDGPGLIGLYGDRGIGKTVMAIQIGHELAKKYPDAQFYINMRSRSANPVSIAKAMGHVIRAFYPSEKLPQDANVLVDEYHSVLKGKRVLIILDDITKPSDAKRLLPSRSSLLLTTSTKKIALPGMFTREVPELYPQESEALLFSCSQRTRSWTEDISKICKNVPLALVLAGNYIETNDAIAMDKIVSDFREEWRDLKSGGDEDERDKKEKKSKNVNVETIFNVSMKELRKEAASVLRRTTLFEGTFDAKAEAAVCGDSNNAYLNQLVKLKLVEYDELNKRYDLHDLIRDLLKPLVRPSERILSGRSHAFYYYSILAEADELCAGENESMESSLNILDLEWTNIRVGQEWAVDKCTDDVEIAKLCSNYTQAGEVLLPFRNLAKVCIKWHEAALTASRQLQNVEAQKNSLLSLGIEFNSMAQHDRALECLEEAQVLAKQLGHTNDEIIAANLFGESCLALGKGALAVEYFLKVFEAAKAEKNKAKEFKVRNNLGVAYEQAGDPKNAISFYQGALSLAKKMEDKPKEGEALHSLSEVYVNCQKPESAVPLIKQGLTISHQYDDKLLENSLLQLQGRAYASMKKFKESIRSYENSIQLCVRLGDVITQGLVWKRLGDVHLDSKNDHEAIECYRKGLPIFQKNKMNFVEYDLLINLGKAHCNVNKHGQAGICFKHSSWLAKNMKDPVKECDSLWRLCQTQDILGEGAMALNTADKAVKICEYSDASETKELEEKIKKWMVARTERQIEDSNL